MITEKACAVCGACEFSYQAVLWPELIEEWELLPEEVAYINRQQGLQCTRCGNNLRSIALADAIVKAYEFDGFLCDFIQSAKSRSIKILEINEAGGLTPTLAQLPHHQCIHFPQANMMSLGFDHNTFDLVIHSDTLEHITDPYKGLEECRRVLTPKGKCIFTVPLIVNRLSRSRKSLKPSYHGDPAQKRNDYIVLTEFGADFWSYPLKAGFKSVNIHAYEYPAAIAIEAQG